MRCDVLIIDDEVELGNATKEYFEAFGVSAAFCDGAASAYAWLKENTTEIILLDINLKDGSGFELCRAVRKEYDMPIFFISARLARDDILLALGIGGDDYIVKPYELSILLAKVKARLLRTAGSKPKSVSAGNLLLDFENRKAYKNGADLALKNKEFLLLAYLVKHAGKTLTKDEIFSAVWGDAFFSDGTLSVHIRKLREKVEDNPDSPERIQTAWGVGYVFKAK